MDKNQLMKLTQTALMAALCFVVFTFLQIKITTPGGATSIHLGNAMCVLAALLLGSLPGDVAGAVGMGLADLMDPLVGYFYKRYLLEMPQEAAEILAKMTSVTTFINAILSTILVVLLYRLLKPTLDRAELHIEIEKYKRTCTSDCTRSFFCVHEL